MSNHDIYRELLFTAKDEGRDTDEFYGKLIQHIDDDIRYAELQIEALREIRKEARDRIPLKKETA